MLTPADMVKPEIGVPLETLEAKREELETKQEDLEVKREDEPEEQDVDMNNEGPDPTSEDECLGRMWYWSPEFGWFEAALEGPRDVRILRVRAKKGKDNRARDKIKKQQQQKAHGKTKKFWNHKYKSNWYNYHFGSR